MTNGLYESGKDYLLNASLSWVGHPIRAGLVSTANQPTAYIADLVNDTFYGNIPTGARVGFSVASLASRSSSGGVADADNQKFTAVSGPTVGAVVIFRSTATADGSDWPLIAYIDTTTGLPFGPNGGDATVQWDDGANKIFKL